MVQYRPDIPGGKIGGKAPKYHCNPLSALTRSIPVGACDSCGAKHFDAQETLRWKKVADAAQHKLVLSPLEIKELQQLVQLSMEQFAVLIGSTRQSLHAWQKQDRTIAQSRMADLMMRLLRESYHHGKIDVLKFLIEQAKLIGIELKVRKQEESPARIVLLARKRLPSQTETIYANELAAETKAERPEVLLVDNGQASSAITVRLSHGLAKPGIYRRTSIPRYRAWDS